MAELDTAAVYDPRVGKASQLATAKGKEKARGRGQNTAAAVPTLEVAAVIRL